MLNRRNGGGTGSLASDLAGMANLVDQIGPDALMGAGGDASDWSEYFGSLERMSQVDRSTYFSFMGNAVLRTDEEKQYADLCLTLASFQMNARCNNRLDALKTARLMLQRRLEDVAAQDLLDDDPDPMSLDEYVLLAPLSQELRDVATGSPVLEKLVRDIDAIQATVERMRTRGWYRDYGYLKRLYIEHGDSALEMLGNRELQAPFFLCRLHEFCAARSAGERPLNIQGMLAKVVVADKDHRIFSAGPLGGLFGRRRRGYSGRQGGDDGDLDEE